MIVFEEALETVMGSIRRVEAEQIDLDAACGRILAADVTSDMDMPPFNKSAMDGYACRRADLDEELTIVETIPSGRQPTRRIGANQCAKIMTGAPVPECADCVIMVEYTESPTESTVRFTGKDTRDNICRRSEDVKA